MLISDLSLVHFRSYPSRHFTFSPNVTLIVGDNTAGKTNIIEAIYTLAVGKSFRAKSDRDMIAWDQEVGHIKGKTTDELLEIALTHGSVGGKKTHYKRFKVNGVPRRLVDFAGKVKIVLFWPEHLDLVIDRPSIRRDYLDGVLIQTDLQYRRRLRTYQRGVRQRNKVLDAISEGVANRSQLEFWDDLLIRDGGYLTDARAVFIDYLNSRRSADLPFRIEYDKSVISRSRLDQYKHAEIGARVTLVGPHRDDFSFYIQKYHGDTQRFVRLDSYGSRGEQRLGTLWAKLSELSYIQQEANDRPVLLLDDILSELDEKRQTQVLQLSKNQQTIITSAGGSETEELVRSIAPDALGVIRLPFEDGS